ncbi:MAG: hypothetical protein F6K54_17535 [Okeania sp. SIO3B5]|uniref:hypothetical protein n=1 Tax=Okeania sp. SIO3B5 TaxID=2607811 RepID=UPI0013FF7249|nr:hypothetical protein [Okeania sp. SIO3B5]NEO54722.1 hypothetical protein [Okeania sp. SIO3B5]
MSKVRIIITLNNPTLDEQELDKAREEFSKEMQIRREQVKEIKNTTPQKGGKAGSYLPELLEAEVELSNLKEISRDAHQASNGKSDITITNGQEKRTVKAANRSREEFAEEVEKAGKLIAS